MSAEMTGRYKETDPQEKRRGLPSGCLRRRFRAPGMGDNLVVKVHYGLGSRNR